MDSLGITPVDIGALGLLIFAGAMGLSSGFIHSVLFIGSWVLAGAGAWRFTPALQPEVQKYVASEQIAYFTEVYRNALARRLISSQPSRTLTNPFLLHHPNACRRPGKPFPTA